MFETEAGGATSFNFSMDDAVKMMNARDLVPKKILELLQKDERIAYINSDAMPEGSNVRMLSEEYPDRVTDVGIAEMNLVGVAAGMALGGKIPFANAFGPFLSLRAVDQIHTDVAYQNLPVRLVATHGGTTSGGGPTHYAICDFAILNAIPNMTVIAPADANQSVKVIEASVEYPGPIFMRIARGEEPQVYPDGVEYDYEIGKSIRVRDGGDATIIGAGVGVWLGLQASLRLEQEGYRVRVIDMHTIKPLDREAVIAAAVETGHIVTVEDHNIQGGLGTLVSAAIAEAGIAAKIKKLGVPDEFAILGYPKTIYPEYGYDVEGVTNTTRALIQS
jgi:transketolase